MDDQQYSQQYQQYQTDRPDYPGAYQGSHRGNGTGQQQELTGMQKFGWFLVGLFFGLPSVLVASLANIDRPYRSDCTKFCLVGACIVCVLFVISMTTLCSANLMTSALYGY